MNVFLGCGGSDIASWNLCSNSEEFASKLKDIAFVETINHHYKVVASGTTLEEGRPSNPQNKEIQNQELNLSITNSDSVTVWSKTEVSFDAFFGGSNVPPDKKLQSDMRASGRQSIHYFCLEPSARRSWLPGARQLLFRRSLPIDSPSADFPAPAGPHDRCVRITVPTTR